MAEYTFTKVFTYTENITVEAESVFEARSLVEELPGVSNNDTRFCGCTLINVEN